MSDEGTSDRSFYFASRLFLVFLITAISSLIGLMIIQYAFYVDSTIRGQAFLISSGCFFLGSLLLVFSKVSKEYALLWSGGFIVAFGVLVLSGMQYIALLVMVYPVEAIAIMAILVVISTYLYLQYLDQRPTDTVPTKTGELISFSRISLSKKVLVGGVELVQLPVDHLAQSSDGIKYRPFLDLLRALSLANIPLTLRLERIHSKTRVFYLTWAKDAQTLSEYIVRLEDNLNGNLIGMKFKRCSEFSGIELETQQTGVGSYLKGEPLSIEDDHQKQDALTVMATVLQQLSNGVVQVSSTPQRTNKRKLKNLEDKYRSEIARSERVISTPKSTILSGDVQESITKVDPDAQRKAVSLAKQIERFSTQHLCKVRVAAVCWDVNKAVAEERSMRLMTTLRGKIVPADKNRNLDIETRSSISEVTQLLRGEPIGQTTLLSIDEAAIFFLLPTCDLGIPVADHATFTSNPATLDPQDMQPVETTKPSICIGMILDESGREIGEFRVPIEDLSTHTGAFGDIGTGKSSTQITITLELQKYGINTLTLLVSKNEDHIRAIRVNKDIRVITLGDETMSPAKFSLTNMIEGIHVNQIINAIKTLFVAAKPTDGIIKEYLEKVIELTFKRLGWDRTTNTRGIPIVLQDFIETLPLVEDELQYSTRGNEDFRGALYGRFTSVCEGVLQNIFGTISGLSIEELVSNSYIILLDKLSVEERSFFMFWLVNSLALHFEAKKKTEGLSKVGLKYYVVLEEAQRTLKRESRTNLEEGHGAHQIALDTICMIMTESRSSGLGFGLVSPDASQLAIAAVKMPLNVFLQKTNSIDDRELIGRQINCNEEQIMLIGSLQRGVAVVRIASYAKPLLVRINNPLEFYPELNPTKPVTDEEIMSHMKGNLQNNTTSELVKGVPHIEDLTIEYASLNLEMLSLARLHTMLCLPQFTKAHESLSELNRSEKSMLVAMLIRDIGNAAVCNSVALPFCYTHLIWILWKTITPWTEEFREKVIADLVQLTSVDRSLLDAGTDLLSKRVTMEIARRRKTGKLKSEDVRKLLTDAFKSATSEFKGSSGTKSPRKEEQASIDERTLGLIDAIVRTKDFADRYPERIAKAEAGDVSPLLRLIEAFSCKLVDSPDSLSEVQTLLLARARAIYDEPADETLWNTINDTLRTGSTESAA